MERLCSPAPDDVTEVVDRGSDEYAGAVADLAPVKVDAERAAAEPPQLRRKQC